MLPDTAPPWKTNQFEDEAKTMLYREARRLKIFFKGGGYDNMKPIKREQLFIKLLEDIEGKYQKAVAGGSKPDGKYKQKISDFYTNVVPYLKGKTSISGAPFASTLLNNGGPDSVYGIGITTTSRGVNTFENGSKSFGDSNGKNT